MRPANRESSKLRQRIVGEATRLFAKQGFAGTSVRELASASECTKPALYYYFENKDTLFLEIINAHTEAVDEILRLGFASEGTVRERIHRMTDAFVAYAQGHPDAMKLMLRLDSVPDDCGPGDVGARREKHMGRMSAIFTRAVREGEIGPKIDPEDCALALSGALHFQIAAAVMTSTWDCARYHRLIDLLFDGISL